MKSALALFLATCLSLSAKAENTLTGKEIYRINCKAVVQIKSGNEFGVGFIVSPDGIIMTANHVVATRESQFRQYARDIEVLASGKTKPYKASPLASSPSDDSVNFDSAVVKIEASNLPHLALGGWGEVQVGDSLVVLPSFPGIGCLMLEGSVSAKAAWNTGFGPKAVNTILFQAPIRNGFSGAPILSKKGHVIGIEDTKVFGISPALAGLRTQWAPGEGHADLQLGGVSLDRSLTEIINNLDQNLISGLGSGVAIDYAKEQQQADKPK